MQRAVGPEADRAVDEGLDDLQQAARGVVGGVAQADHEGGLGALQRVDEPREGVVEPLEGVELDERGEVLQNHAARPVRLDHTNQVAVRLLEALGAARGERLDIGDAEDAEVAARVGLREVEPHALARLDERARLAGRHQERADALGESGLGHLERECRTSGAGTSGKEVGFAGGEPAPLAVDGGDPRRDRRVDGGHGQGEESAAERQTACQPPFAPGTAGRGLQVEASWGVS
ncbi:MAG: hypothetical protein AAF594_09175 [Bacteroidota bacterium]